MKTEHIVGGGSYTNGQKVKEPNPEFVEFGVLPKQGKRTDLDEIKDQIMNGKKVDDIALENPEMYHQYGRTLNKLEDIALRKRFRNWTTKGYWLYGGTGIGKSHVAFKNYNPDTHYVKNLNEDWWDGYTGQEVVIFNEFRGQIKYSELLDLMDKWPKTVKIRNRQPVPFLAKCVIITSALEPSEVYHNLSGNDKLAQLTRRCQIIEKLKGIDLEIDFYTDMILTTSDDV